MLLIERIKEKAYFYYINKGRIEGHALTDWFRAEKEVLKEIELEEKAKQELREILNV